MKPRKWKMWAVCFPRMLPDVYFDYQAAKDVAFLQNGKLITVEVREIKRKGKR